MTLRDAAGVTFLALAAYREGRSEGPEGVLAICYSILNRVARPSWWGNDIQSVLFKKWQYSSLTNPHDPQLTTWPNNSKEPSWEMCLQQAAAAIAGSEPNPVAGADSYYDDSIAAPKWTVGARFVAKIGKLTFYDIDHDHEVATAISGKS